MTAARFVFAALKNVCFLVAVLCVIVLAMIFGNEPVAHVRPSRVTGTPR